MEDEEFEQEIRDTINYHLTQHRLTHGAFQFAILFGEVILINLN